MSSGNGGIELIVILKQNKLINAFLKAGALSPQSALSVDEMGIKNSRIFNALIKATVIKTTNDKYYMDELRAIKFKKSIRRIFYF